MEICKREIEELLGTMVTEEQYQEALECAKNKQAYIFAATGRTVVLQSWYLLRLTEEYIRNLAFSQYTEKVCKGEVTSEGINKNKLYRGSANCISKRAT